MNINNVVQLIEEELFLLRNDEKAAFYQKFFKTGKGEYAEGDKFLGIVNPAQRKIAKTYYKTAELEHIPRLLKSEWHECRLTSLMILTMKMQRTKDIAIREQIVSCYLAHLDYINNWDLVDISAPYILGIHLLNNSDQSLLYKLAESGNLWRQRISIITTLYFIREGYFDTSLELAEKLVYHKHDLMHKAVGWVLREVGKRDIDLERQFLDRYAKTMPRTALRYAIEKFTDNERKKYMAR